VVIAAIASRRRAFAMRGMMPHGYSPVGCFVLAVQCSCTLVGTAPECISSKWHYSMLIGVEGKRMAFSHKKDVRGAQQSAVNARSCGPSISWQPAGMQSINCHHCSISVGNNSEATEQLGHSNDTVVEVSEQNGLIRSQLSLLLRP